MAQLSELAYDDRNILIIPDNVEKTIRNLCALSPDNEWSGVLFYSFEGDFDSGLTLTCKDILLLDRGGAVATEFDASNPNIARHMMLNGLINCCIGLIHSHHTMQTFFSGTDINTLLKEGEGCNNFLSLIVNNAGIYNANITRKIKTTKEIDQHIVTKGQYTLFNTDTVVSVPETEFDSHTIKDEILVEYTKLNIQKNSNIEASPECMAFSQLEPKRFVPKTSYPNTKPFSNTYTQSKPWLSKPTGDYYGDLFEGYGIRSKNEISEDYEGTVEDSEKDLLEEQCKSINWNDRKYLIFLEKLFFGTPFITTPKHSDFKSEIDYIIKAFPSMCKKAFESVEDAKQWFWYSLDYFLYETELPEAKLNPEFEECFDYEAVIAYRIAKALEPYTNKSEYIKVVHSLLLTKI